MTLYRSYSVWFRTSRLDETSLPMALSMGEIRAAAAAAAAEEEDGTRCPPLAPLTAPSHCLPIEGIEDRLKRCVHDVMKLDYLDLLRPYSGYL